jgi:hypothetical protein
MNKEKILDKYYSSFLNKPKIAHDLHEKQSQVDKAINNQEVYQLTKQVRNPRQYNSINALFVGQCCQMDIIEYSRFEFNNFKYILCIIDVYSRYLFSYPLENHRASTIIKILKNLFDSEYCPNNINLDNEFNNDQFKKLFKKYDVNVWYSVANKVNKNNIVERVNGTLERLIQKYRISTNNKNWSEYLPLLVDYYNNNYHSTIKSTPSEIYNDKDFNHQKVSFVKPKLKIGDSVRIISEGKFKQKGDKVRVTKRIYKIEGKYLNRFILGNDKMFMEYQLMKVDIPVEKYKGYKEELKDMKQEEEDILKRESVERQKEERQKEERQKEERQKEERQKEERQKEERQKEDMKIKGIRIKRQKENGKLKKLRLLIKDKLIYDAYLTKARGNKFNLYESLEKAEKAVEQLFKLLTKHKIKIDDIKGKNLTGNDIDKMYNKFY